MNENTENTQATTVQATEIDLDALFESVPAKLKIMIGKRARFFEDTDKGREEAKAALLRFQTGAVPNKGIQAARKVAKELMLKFQAPIEVYVAGLEDMTDKSRKGRINVLTAFFKDMPEELKESFDKLYPVLETAVEEIVEAGEAVQQVIETVEEVKEDLVDTLTDPLDDLL